MIAIVGVVFGILGFAVGVAAFLRRSITAAAGRVATQPGQGDD